MAARITRTLSRLQIFMPSKDSKLDTKLKKLKSYLTRGIITRTEYNCKVQESRDDYSRLNKGDDELELDIRFTKTGLEIKHAVGKRIGELKQRLDSRNESLTRFLSDTELVRSYLVRSSKGSWGHSGMTWPEGTIASEQMEEIRQLCERIFELEAEINRLSLIKSHLDDDRQFNLLLEDMTKYGFKPNDG